MTLLAPGFLLAAALVALAVAALHAIVPHEPRPALLPTARFAPQRAASARARTGRPRDPLLLAIRAGLILAAGTALARPLLHPSRRPLARILLVDRSRAVASAAEAADSARTLYAAGDAVVLFDSAAAALRADAPDSLAALARSQHAGRLSAGLVAALREAARLRGAADSLELVIVSPLVVEEADGATDSIRALWPGAVRLVRVAARHDAAASAPIDFDGPADDPLRLALPGAAGGAVRLRRGPLAAGDSAWLRSGLGPRVLVHWPERANGAIEQRGAVSAGAVVVVAPLARTIALPPEPGARVVARWADGSPAAVEQPYGAGCIRTIAVGVPVRGDVVLEPRFARFVAAVTAPCGGDMDLRPLGRERLAALAGDRTAPRRVAGHTLAASTTAAAPVGSGLLLVALALAVAELAVRRRAAGRGI